MNPHKQRIIEAFDKKFSVFQTRNYTSDSIIGKFDKNGNILPSEEMERLDFSSDIKSFILTQLDIILRDMVEKCVPPATTDWTERAKRMLDRGDSFLTREGLKVAQLQSKEEGFLHCRGQTLQNFTHFISNEEKI